MTHQLLYSSEPPPIEDYVDVEFSGLPPNYTVDYNISDSFNDVPLTESLPLIMAYTITLILGVVGNSLVMFSIAYYRRMRTTTNVFLFSLASADLLLVTICIPIKAAKFLSFTWTFGEPLCKIVYFVQNWSMICSVLTLAWIAIERVVAVSFPLKARYISTNHRAHITVIVIWCASFVLATPILHIQGHMAVGHRFPAFWCVKNLVPKTAAHIVFEVYMVIILFILPLTVMMFSYGFISFKVWFVTEVRADMRSGRVVAPANQRHSHGRTSGVDRSLLYHHQGRGGAHMSHPRTLVKDDSSQDRRTTKQLVIMLVMIVVLFAICWGPVQVDNLLVAIGFHSYLNYGSLKLMRQAIHLMSYFNSCVNPIVYAFMSKNFRQSFKFAICACIKGRAFVRAYRFSMSLTQTRTSVVSTNGKARPGFNDRREKSSSSENEYIKATMPSPDDLELKSMDDNF